MENGIIKVIKRFVMVRLSRKKLVVCVWLCMFGFLRIIRIIKVLFIRFVISIKIN